jgi:phosphoglycerate kinase
VADDTRIRAALSTIDELRRRGARLVLISHLDARNGPDPTPSMRPVADRLAQLSGTPMPLAPAVTGAQVRELTHRLQDGQMLMLENVRLEPGESRNDPTLVSAMAELADLYVDDSFSSAHLAHASTWDVTRLLPAAGRLMEREVHALSALVERPVTPLVVILGGARVGEKLGVLQRFLALADAVCIGGGMAFPFLAALGHTVGRSNRPPDDVETVRMALAESGGSTERLALPSDLLLARCDQGKAPTTCCLDGIDVPAGWTALDIGPETAERFGAAVAAAATVLWSGPMGRFELPPFASGTRAIAAAVASTSATTVAAGGENVRALRHFGLQDRISHLSAGGTAMLEFLEGRQLPGVEVLLHERDVPVEAKARPARRMRGA